MNQTWLRKKVPSDLQERNLKKQGKIKMKFQLRKCLKCFEYTLKEKCQQCHNETVSAHPAKFSPDDKYLRYRLIGK